MGGQAGSRGYIYQGIVSIFEALQQETWSRIYVEYSSPNDKVDVALSDNNGGLIKSIQVKSSINLFSKAEIKRWIEYLVQDISAQEYQLVLIGSCDLSANKFYKSVNKYVSRSNNQDIDKETLESLGQFKDKLDKYKVSIRILPFDEDALIGVVRDKIHEYISGKGYILEFCELEQLAYALLSIQMLLGTKGEYITKESYDKKIFEWLSCSASGALKCKEGGSRVQLFSYNCEKQVLQPEISTFKVEDLPSYRKIYNDLMLEGKKLISQISSISLNKYSPISSCTDNNTPLNDDNIQLSQLIGTRAAEKSKADQIKFIKEVRNIWQIELDEEFFYVGNLIKSDLSYHITGRISYQGTSTEREKNDMISELGSIMLKLEVLKTFVEYMKKVKIIPLCIKNTSKISDEEISIVLNIKRGSYHIFNFIKDGDTALKDLMDSMADILIEEKLVKSILDIQGDDIVGVEEQKSVYLPQLPIHIGMFNRRTKHDFKSLMYEVETYQAEEVDGFVSYEINSLRSGETKWLSPYLLLVSEEDKLEISYRILSKHLGKEIRDIITINSK